MKRTLFRSWLTRRDGSVPVEYGALALLGAVILIGAFQMVGSETGGMFSFVSTSISSASTGG